MRSMLTGRQVTYKHNLMLPVWNIKLKCMLYFIWKASDGIEEFDYDLNDSHDEACWSPEKRKPKRKRRRKIVGRSTLRSRILGNSSVVVSTLSGAGSKAFVDAVCRDPTRNDSEFDGEGSYS